MPACFFCFVFLVGGGRGVGRVLHNEGSWDTTAGLGNIRGHLKKKKSSLMIGAADWSLSADAANR